ncbi:MAG TPA: reverse transcriptase family protein [Bacteroidales bacterium]|nr:reverse transcriptase family protein [Bacteroidales bacterium]
MTNTSTIIEFARRNKGVLQNHLADGSLRLPVALEILEKHQLNALYLLSIETPIDLCSFFKSGLLQLESIINNPQYTHYTIKKKRGGNRHIYAPNKKLKAIQKRLNYFLQAYYLMIKPEEVHGFVVNPHYLGSHCNIVENAKAHTGKKHLLNIDLKDFFPRITAKQVLDLFSSPVFGYSDQVATAITLLCTYEGRLPAGAPSSPVISNFICLNLDADLKAFCATHNLEYTRYADDLTFSSNAAIETNTLLDIISLIQKNNFEINSNKLRIRPANRRQIVTGLTVNEKVNVNRKMLKKIRAMLHDLSTNGVETATQKHFKITGKVKAAHEAKFLQRLEGYINFVGQVRGKSDPLYIGYKNQFEQVFEN